MKGVFIMGKKIIIGVSVTLAAGLLTLLGRARIKAKPF